MFDEMCRLIYVKAPNPTEKLPVSHYFMLEAERILDNGIIKKYDMVPYIKSQIDSSEVRHISLFKYFN